MNGITSLGGPGGIHGQLIDALSPGPYPSLSFNTFYNGSSYLAGVAGYAGIFQFQDGDGKFGFYSTSSSVAAGAPHTFTPRLTVDKDGNVGIGGPGFVTGGKLHVEGGGSHHTGVYGDGRLVGVYGSGGTWAGYFQGNVRVTGTLTQGSDARLKQKVANLGYGLREVLQLRPVTWSWKAKPDGGRQLGLIAQEVESVLPELVSIDKDAERTKGLNYIGLVPVTIKAIQEQQAQIEDQQEKLEQQQRQIDGLKLLVCLDHPDSVVCN